MTLISTTESNERFTESVFGAYVAIGFSLGILVIASIVIAKWRLHWSGEIWVTPKAQKVLRAAEAMGPFWERALKSMMPFGASILSICLSVLIISITLGEQGWVRLDHPFHVGSIHAFFSAFALFISIILLNRPKTLIPPYARYSIMIE